MEKVRKSSHRGHSRLIHLVKWKKGRGNQGGGEKNLSSSLSGLDEMETAGVASKRAQKGNGDGAEENSSAFLMKPFISGAGGEQNWVHNAFTGW